jgi:hypothetical protein
MTTDEVCFAIAGHGLYVEAERLYDWANAKLIPPSAKVDGVDQWPPETWWQASVACYLLDQQGWTVTELQVARFHMAETLTTGGNPLDRLDWFFRHSPAVVEGLTEQYHDAFEWTIAAIKAQSTHFPFAVPAEILVAEGPDDRHTYSIKIREGWPRQEPLRESLLDVIRDEAGRSHPREVKLPEAGITPE